jgi:hypothetical protein
VNTDTSRGEGKITDSSSSDSDDSLLNGVLAKQAKKLKGDKRQSFSPLESHISTQVPYKLQKKIWRHKFVGFGALLPITFGHDQDETPYQFSVNQTNGNFHLVPSIKTQKINNIEQWTTAFMRIVAIYAMPR